MPEKKFTAEDFSFYNRRNKTNAASSRNGYGGFTCRVSKISFAAGRFMKKGFIV
jgi:hypothetical protein